MVWGRPNAGVAGEVVEDWVGVLPADFVSLTAFKDPNSILSGPIVHQGGSIYRFPMVQNGAVIADGVNDGASLRLNWPSNWDGVAGLFGVQWRITPQGNAPFASAMLGAAIADRGGDATFGGARMGGASIEAVTVSTLGVGGTGDGFGGSATSQLSIGDSPRLIVTWKHSGPNIGDNTTSGFRSTRLCSFTGDLYDDSMNFQCAGLHSNNGPTDGIYQLITAGHDAIGGGSGDWDALIERRLFRAYPNGTFD